LIVRFCNILSKHELSRKILQNISAESSPTERDLFHGKRWPERYDEANSSLSNANVTERGIKYLNTPLLYSLIDFCC